MEINGVEIENTYAEAFDVKMSRGLVTAATQKWAKVAATEATGFGTSVIMCPAEAGIERIVTGDETPDGRPGAYIQLYTFGFKSIEQQVMARVGQCILTAPTTAFFNGLPDVEKQIVLGKNLGFFGDGFQSAETIYDREVYRIPMMEGDFIVENTIGAQAGVAGGNFLILAKNQLAGLAAAENAVKAISKCEGTITPFPGGIVASGSKPGSLKYKFMKATTNQQFAPTLKDKIDNSLLPSDVNAVYEIVINGTDVDVIKESTKAGIIAATHSKDIVKISAGNYGGTLGKHLIQLHELF